MLQRIEECGQLEGTATGRNIFAIYLAFADLEGARSSRSGMNRRRHGTHGSFMRCSDAPQTTGSACRPARPAASDGQCWSGFGTGASGPPIPSAFFRLHSWPCLRHERSLLALWPTRAHSSEQNRRFPSAMK